MGKISINELNDNLQRQISGGALDEDAYLRLTAQVDANIQRLQTLTDAAAVSAATYSRPKPQN